MASFKQWLEAFQQIYHLSPERASEVECPNCGARELQLRFVTYRPDGEAHMAFWCGNCLEGISLGPSEVPEAYHRVRREEANIPDYRIVPPSGRDGINSGS